MELLYPLKFKPLFKDRIWGGEKIKSVLGKDFAPLKQCGESWEISCLPDNESVVENGFFAGNELQEIIEIYMGDLVGDKVFEQFGTLFPLLIKFIDARETLSIQVHPGDELALERHQTYGKTEMWYVIDASPDAEIISGFNTEISKEGFIEKVKNNELQKILNNIPAKKGDVFFIPAGRIHAIGKGVLLTEIQQISDITYRIYDWKRVDKNGKSRELHTEQAVDAIDYSRIENCRTSYTPKKNETVQLETCPYFNVNLLQIDKAIEKDYIEIDSFVIYICTEGAFSIEYDDEKFFETKAGDCILLPAIFKNVKLIPKNSACILEVFIK